MWGVFDVDQDNLVEFLTIEEGRRNNTNITLTGLYEINELGYPQPVWSFETPGNVLGTIKSARLMDMDGDGDSEISLVINRETEAGLETGFIYLFDWIQGAFSQQPDLILSLSDQENPEVINSIDIIDLEGDGREDLLVSSQGFDKRTVTILSLTGEKGARRFREIWSHELEEFTTSGGKLFAFGLDYNRDGMSDIVAFSPERNVLRIQFFLNQNGRLILGPSHLRRIPGMAVPLSNSAVKLDWAGDNQDELLIPFQSGHVVSIGLVKDAVFVRELGINTGPLSDLKQSDFNQDGYSDLLFVSGQQGIITLAYGGAAGSIPLQQPYSIGNTETGAQIFTAIPEIIDGIYLGTVIAGGWTGDESEVFYFELGHVPEYQEEIPMDTYLAESKKETVIEEPPSAYPAEGQLLPPGILPTYILPVHQTFAYTIPEEDDREFFSFRWLGSPPRGMYFHYETRSIEWVPDESQLGAYELSFLVKMKVGETIEVIATEVDTTVTYQVVPELATSEQKFWIYVNDPPQIISSPGETEFVAGSPFRYQVESVDKNKDSFLRYTVEKGPEGMTVNKDGFLTWQTNDFHINIYGVRIVVSDGFDRDVQTFKLYSRGQVVITSQTDIEATVDEKYEYQLEVRIPEDKQKELKYTLINPPYGMMVDNIGKITWTPQSTQVDTQKYSIAVNHGIAADTQGVAIFVNHPPILKSIPEPMTYIALRDTFEFQLVVEDPNEFDIIRYAPLEMPPGMRIDPSTGLLVWVPLEENLDFSTAVVEITDGRTVIERSFKFYVNANIHIVSEPMTLASVGKAYTYKISIEDMNAGALMPFSNITEIEDVNETKVYSIIIEDDVYLENIQRYIGEFKNKKSILIELQNRTNDEQSDEESVSRVNLKKFVKNIFYEDDRLIVVTKRFGGQWIKIKDVMWHFFEGNKGKPPRVVVEQVPIKRYTLIDFPDGMFVDEISGTITWTPSQRQYDQHKITFMTSDGFTRDEQNYEIYVNHPPTIVSTSPRKARVNKLYKYRVVVEDKNRNKDISYELVKAPKGMQINRLGKITWRPTSTQINSNLMAVKVSDGYSSDIQESKIFVNMPPTVITEPKPVALSNFEYRYRFVTEDLNGDKVKYRAIKLPKYASFDSETGLLQWKPRINQKGVHDIVLSAVDERGAATSHEFRVHVFEDPASQQFVSTSWPILLAFVGILFSVGVSAIQ